MSSTESRNNVDRKTIESSTEHMPLRNSMLVREHGTYDYQSHSNILLGHVSN